MSSVALLLAYSAAPMMYPRWTSTVCTRRTRPRFWHPTCSPRVLCVRTALLVLRMMYPPACTYGLWWICHTHLQYFSVGRSIACVRGCRSIPRWSRFAGVVWPPLGLAVSLASYTSRYPYPTLSLSLVQPRPAGELSSLAPSELCLGFGDVFVSWVLYRPGLTS